MEEKRISLRFRMNNEMDQKAWKLLEEMALKENTSKNAIAIELLHMGAKAMDGAFEDGLAERISEMVVEKLDGKFSRMLTGSDTKAVASEFSSVMEKKEVEPLADELGLISEDALDFMEAFA